MDGEAADGDADGFGDLKNLLRSPPHQPPGWPGFLQGSEDLVQRGGLFDDERLAFDVGTAVAEQVITQQAGRGDLQEGNALAPSGIARPETPLMAYVDRASFPGFLDESEFKCGQSPRRSDRPEAHLGVADQSPLSPGAVKLTPRHMDWEAQPSEPSSPVVAHFIPSSVTAAAARLPIASRFREEDWEADLLAWKKRYGCADTSQTSPSESKPSVAEAYVSAPVPPSIGSTCATVRPRSPVQAQDMANPGSTETAAAPASPPPDDAERAMSTAQDTIVNPGLSNETEAASPPAPPVDDAMPTEAQDDREVAVDSPVVGPEQVPPGRPDRPPSRRDKAQAIVVAKPQRVEAPPDSLQKPMYTKQDLEIATQTARSKAAGEDGWKSDFQEAALNVRDFFQDLRKSRHREKGRQATGPLWLHLAAQAKNLADQFDLDQLLEVLKLFCSVRYEDYELYMRLLGEVPHYVKKAGTEQLCQLARLLARRRLRERNYVDMVVAHLLHKVRVSEEGLTIRLLVKTANALAALECRSQPKFVEHFNRHFEHRIEELDEEMCCMVSPVFLVNYMSDALRRSFLKRCAEIQAGFSGEFAIRNLACIELALRKEQHSLVASLPSFVVRYLEKVRAQSEFDKWGSVVLPTTIAPDGPRGDDRHELSVALLRKAAGSKGNSTSDVFSSDMHRDVSACLTHLGIEHENGVVTGPYLLDIVAKDMVNPARRIIYEVNSPHHFFEGTKALVADKRLRHRLLGRLGHQLHMVNAADWRPLSAAAKMTFLLKIQQEQQDKHSEEYKQQAAANVNRAPVARPAKQREPLKLKSPKDDSKPPITVPVPPSLRQQLPQSVMA